MPPSGAANADLTAQLRLFDTLFADALVCVNLDHAVLNPAVADTSQPVTKLAGRDLLAVYSLLRC